MRIDGHVSDLVVVDPVQQLQTENHAQIVVVLLNRDRGPIIEAKHVMAWKAVGAGGGGCALLLVRPSTQDLVKQSCEKSGWSIIEWGFDENGLSIENE